MSRLILVFILVCGQAIAASPEPPRFASKVSFLLDADWLDGLGFVSIRRCVPFRRQVCATPRWSVDRTDGPPLPRPGHESIHFALNPFFWRSIGLTVVEWSLVSSPEWSIRFHRDSGFTDPHRWFIQCEQDKDRPAIWACLAELIGGGEPGDEVDIYLEAFYGGGPIPFILEVESWTRAYDGRGFDTVSSSPDWEPFPAEQTIQVGR